ncbi:hypothetical protein L596_026791 [Steinernema carpocapsae]|uniref:Uncharacterized protein n=1 Tax=Steinernema carpocapsae TaxID=34508 RepID=A0A4U5M2E0_STECR|nr:hypothetical protein L596_026791 [Steinernema carpocapsae]
MVAVQNVVLVQNKTVVNKYAGRKLAKRNTNRVQAFLFLALSAVEILRQCEYSCPFAPVLRTSSHGCPI